MKSTHSWTLAAVTTVAALTASSVYAGTQYEFEVTDNRRGKTEVTTLQTDGSNLRMGMAAQSRKDQGGAMIFQGDRREGKPPRMIVEDGEGGHMVLTQEKIDQLVGQIPSTPQGTPVMSPEMIATARAQAERLADPESRARALELLDQRFGSKDGAAKPSMEYVEKGIREKFGYPCMRYDVLKDGQKIAEVWATDWANIEGGRETSKAFKELEEFYRGLMASLEKATGMSGMFGGAETSFERIFKFNRFPVATYEHDGDEVVRSSVLKSAKKTDVDPSVFKPAPGSVERSFGM